MSRSRVLMKNTGILMIGKISTQFVNFILLPLYTHKLSTEEYGILDLYITIANILIPVITLQLEQGVFRFLITKEYKKGNIISSTTIYLILVSIVITLLYYPISQLYSLEDAILIWGYYITYMFYTVAIQITRGFGNNKLYALTTFLASLTIIFFNIVFILIFNFSVNGILISHVIAYSFATLLVVYRLNIKSFIKFSEISFITLKSLIKYSFPLVFNQISSWIINYSDRMIIIAFLGLGSNGIYSLANKFFIVLITIFNIYNMAWTESVAKTIHDEDRNLYYRKIINLTIQVYLLGGIWIITLMALCFKYLINNTYYEAYFHIPILIIAAVFSGLSATIGSLYIGHMKTKSIGVTTFMAALVNICIHLFAIQYIGLFASSISTLVAFLVLFIYRVLGLKKIEPIKIEFKPIFYFLPFLLLTCYTYLLASIIWHLITLVIVLLISILFLIKRKSTLIILLKRG